MKEIQQQSKDKTDIEKQAEINKGLKHVGSSQIRPGHTMFEYNVQTGELKEADIESKTILKGGEAKTYKRIVTKEWCQYFSCLNRKNAIKKLNAIGVCVNN